MSSVANFIARLMHVERRRDGRVPAHGVEAFYRTHAEERPVCIKNISATGIYLITAERWPPESNVSVTLRRKGFFGRSGSPQAQMKARVARWGEDGVGLTFVPSHMPPSDWLALMDRAGSTSWHQDIVSRFRSASAMAFLACICPDAYQEILLVLGDDLYNDRAQRVIEIALEVENQLPEGMKCDQIHLDPNLLLRIFEGSAHNAVHEANPFWAGLLASSCLKKDVPSTTIAFVDTLSQLNPIQVRIFTSGCDAAMRRGASGAGDEAPTQIFCTQEEIRKIARIRNLGQIERDLLQLHSLGLLEQTRKERWFGEIQQANLTPTRFGMQLYSRCSGRLRAFSEL